MSFLNLNLKFKIKINLLCPEAVVTGTKKKPDVGPGIWTPFNKIPIK